MEAHLPCFFWSFFFAAVVAGAVVSIVQVKVAGLASTLPAWSIPRTWNVWGPSASGL